MSAILNEKRFFLCRFIIWDRTQYNTVSFPVAIERISSRLYANTVKSKAHDAIITTDVLAAVLAANAGAKSLLSF